jgi:hypothetical protein
VKKAKRFLCQKASFSKFRIARIGIQMARIMMIVLAIVDWMNFGTPGVWLSCIVAFNLFGVG